jgi:hypothetical protein
MIGRKSRRAADDFLPSSFTTPDLSHVQDMPRGGGIQGSRSGNNIDQWQRANPAQIRRRWASRLATDVRPRPEVARLCEATFCIVSGRTLAAL